MEIKEERIKIPKVDEVYKNTSPNEDISKWTYKVAMEIVEEKDRALIEAVYKDMQKNKEKYGIEDIDEIIVIGRERIKDLLQKGIKYELEHK